MAYRVIVPAGSRYMLHLSDQFSEEGKRPEDPVTVKSISLNGWREGSDAILFYNFDTNGKPPTLVVRCNGDHFFDYSPTDWISGTRSVDFEDLGVKLGQQKAFSTDETIVFFWRQNPDTKRGLML